VPKPHFIRNLRASQTQAEQRLWYHFRAHRFMGLKFKRQKQLGPYIVDFVCMELKLVVEADGGQHGDETDARRDAWFARNGFTVLRFWNNEVLRQTESALERVREVAMRLGHVDAPALSPGPSPASGRGEQTGGLPESGAECGRAGKRETTESASVGCLGALAEAAATKATDLPSPASGRGEQTGGLPESGAERGRAGKRETPELASVGCLGALAEAATTRATDLPSPASGRGDGGEGRRSPGLPDTESATAWPSRIKKPQP